MNSAPDWVTDKDTQKTWNKNYYRNPNAMYIARASAKLLRVVDPLPSIHGIQIKIDASIDETFTEDPIVLDGNAGDIIDTELVEEGEPISEEKRARWRTKMAQHNIPANDEEQIIRKATNGRVESILDLRANESEKLSVGLTEYLAVR
jgi:hypothetical protein